MSIPISGWSNKGGTAGRSCSCGSWRQHWINYANKKWPISCSVSNCFNTPVLGGHVINSQVDGERIVPMCDECNKLTGTFTLKIGVVVLHANKSITCG